MKKTLITSRKHERITVRRKDSSDNCFFCPICGATDVFPVGESGLICETSIRDFFRLIEEGKIHFSETPSGILLICLTSLKTEIRNLKQ